jgi:hypothetical protein
MRSGKYRKICYLILLSFFLACTNYSEIYRRSQQKVNQANDYWDQQKQGAVEYYSHQPAKLQKILAGIERQREAQIDSILASRDKSLRAAQAKERRNTALFFAGAAATLGAIAAANSTSGGGYDSGGSSSGSNYQDSTPDSSYSNNNAHRQNVCVKYKKRHGWSKGYKVQGTIIKGSELSRKTGSYKYNSYSTYVVVFWDNDEASVLELDYYYGSISGVGVSAKDQRNRPWEVSSSSICY